MTKPFLTAAIAATMLGSGAAYAATVTTSVDVAFSDTGTVVVSDSDSQVNATSNASIFDPNSGASMTGFQQANGVSALQGDMFLASGEQPGVMTGVARQVITETNSSGTAQDYALDYALTGMSFFLHGDYGGASGGPNPFGGTVDAPGARFSYEVFLDGSSIFFAGLEAYGGGFSGYQIDNAVNASGTVNEYLSFGGFCCDGADILIDDIIGSLSLGSIADGTTFEVETVLTMEFIANGFENIVSGTLGDPTGLNAGTLTTTAPPIPLPAAGWLLLGALGGLGALKRRKS